MTLKRYQKIKMLVVIILAIFFSQAIIFKTFLIPIGMFLVGVLALFYLRNRVTEVVADERDRAVAGKSALLAIQIFSWLGVIGMFGFNAFQDINPSYLAISRTLALTICILMLLYSFIFHFYK